MAKRVIREDVISHERWLVSYADFLTLMLAFFVVMYSVSQINESKYRVLSQTLTEAFNVPEMSLKPIQVGEPVTAIQGQLDADLNILGEQPGTGNAEQSAEPQLPEEFEKISTRIEREFEDLIDQRLVSVQGNEEWLEIELKSSMLFASGDASPSPVAEEIIAELSDIVRDSPLPVRVEGFTDNVPIENEVYPSNWELSAARAASIVKLMEQSGVAPSRLAAIGYGEFQPVADNSTQEGRAENRRVVLMISRNANLRPDLPRPERSVSESTVEETGSTEVNVIRIELEGGGVLFTNDPARGEALGRVGSASAEEDSP